MSDLGTRPVKRRHVTQHSPMLPNLQFAEALLIYPSASVAVRETKTITTSLATLRHINGRVWFPVVFLKKLLLGFW